MRLKTTLPPLYALLGALCWGVALASIATGAEETFRPLVPRPGSTDYEEGGYVYERNCAICHGPLGDGKGEMAAALGIKPRSFRSGLFKYRSTSWGKLPTTEDLQRVVRHGISGTAMGMFSQLSDEEVRTVVEYLKTFSRKWRKPENYAPPVALPPPPSWLSDTAQRDRHAALGKKTFDLVCAACHGPAADGHGPAAPSLKDDAGAPAVPADLRQPHLHSGDEPIDIYRVLVTGLNGTPMLSFADAFSPDQKWDLVAYLLSLRAAFASGEK